MEYTYSDDYLAQVEAEVWDEINSQDSVQDRFKVRKFVSKRAYGRARKSWREIILVYDYTTRRWQELDSMSLDTLATEVMYPEAQDWQLREALAGDYS